MTGRQIVVAEGNAAQAEAWDGQAGAYWALEADRFDSAVAHHHGQFMAAANLQPGEVVLDVGCGAGQTSIEGATRAAGGRILGVDLSNEMLEVARRRARASGIGNVSFEQADAEVHDFGRDTFDVVISRTGAMFFGDPAAAFSNLGRSLRPGGRLVLMTWQSFDRNEWMREFVGALSAGREFGPPPDDAPGPFGLSDPARINSVLTGAGFTDIDCAGFEAPMNFGPDAASAFDFVIGLNGWMLDGLDGPTKTEAVERLRKVMAGHASAAGVLFDAASWMVSAARPSVGG